MSAGKRHGTGEPLTEHDIAERLEKALRRVARIMADVDAMGLRDEVKASRYFTGMPLREVQTMASEWLASATEDRP